MRISAIVIFGILAQGTVSGQAPFPLPESLEEITELYESLSQQRDSARKRGDPQALEGANAKLNYLRDNLFDIGQSIGFRKAQKGLKAQFDSGEAPPEKHWIVGEWVSPFGGSYTFLPNGQVRGAPDETIRVIDEHHLVLSYGQKIFRLISRSGNDQIYLHHEDYAVPYHRSNTHPDKELHR